MEIVPHGMTATMLEMDGYGKVGQRTGDMEWTWNLEKLQGLDQDEVTKLIIQLTWK